MKTYLKRGELPKIEVSGFAAWLKGNRQRHKSNFKVIKKDKWATKINKWEKTPEATQFYAELSTIKH